MNNLRKQKQTMFSASLLIKTLIVFVVGISLGIVVFDLGINQQTATVAEAVSTKILPSSLASVTYTTTEEQQLAAAELSASYSLWKHNYLQARGGGMDVVAYGDDQNVQGHRLSEARGYGMILAAMMGDRLTMDELLLADLNVQKTNGLSPWDIDANDKVADVTAATDGEEDMAFGAILADKLWGNETDIYRSYATNKIRSIRENVVESDTLILKPGDTWGGSTSDNNAINPSYLRAAYYPLFAQYTNDETWNQILTTNFNIAKESADPTTGLVPDWSTTDGLAVTDYDALSHDAGEDAARYPLFLTQYAISSHNEEATDQLKKINNTLKDDGPSEDAGRTLSGTIMSQTPDVAFISGAAVAAMIDPDTDYRRATLDTLIATRGTYYGESLRLLALGIISRKLLVP
jgi:endo-1,4-beta-D-glucanase Y